VGQHTAEPLRHIDLAASAAAAGDLRILANSCGSLRCTASRRSGQLKHRGDDASSSSEECGEQMLDVTA